MSTPSLAGLADDDRRLPRRLRRPITTAASTPNSPGHARPQRGGLSDARRRHVHLRQGQGDGAHLRRVLRQRHQRHARRLDRLDLCRPARAGSLRHRILAARGGEAAAHAEAEVAGRPDRAGHRRRRRHRPRDRRRGCLREGACVVLADIDEAALAAANDELAQGATARTSSAPVQDRRHQRRGRSSPASPRRRSSSAASTSWSPMPASPPRRRSRRRRWRCGTRTWTSWRPAISWSSREAFRLFRAQKIGGNVVFVASKNGLAASPNAAAYCTAKAAEIHLARCLALEGAEAQIRVNVGQPGRGAARLEDLDRRVEGAARRRLQDVDRTIWRSTTASARC